MIELLWNNPISESRLEQYFNALSLHPGQQVLDVGCGCGEVLIRLSERYRIQGTGIDTSAEHVAEAVRRAAGRTADAVRFLTADARSFHVEPDSQDLVICLGSTHAFCPGSDAYANALTRMQPLVVSGGLLLVADGCLKQPAPPEYRRFLRDAIPDGMTHFANVVTGRDLGLIPLAAWTSSQDEWDEFEWSYQRIIEQKARESPNDEQVRARLNRRREWMDAYLKWGRDTLGFGVYLFRKP